MTILLKSITDSGQNYAKANNFKSCTGYEVLYAQRCLSRGTLRCAHQTRFWLVTAHK